MRPIVGLRGPGRSLRQAAALALLAGLGLVLVRAALGAELPRADFVMNNGGEIASLDPAAVSGIPEGRVIRALYEGLVVKDPRTLAPLPGTAESWEVSADGLRYAFHLRGDARWTDGTPVTARDFEWSWRRLLAPEPAAPYARLLDCVKGAARFAREATAANEGVLWSEVGIRAPGDARFEVELAHPVPYFLDLCAHHALCPVSRRALERARQRFPDTWQVAWL